MAESSLVEDVDELSLREGCDIEPYLYEPTCAEVVTDSDASDSSDATEISVDGAPGTVRVGGNFWCRCGNCSAMGTEIESICCREIEAVDNKVEEASLECITDHEGFIATCLNRHVIETLMYQFIEDHGPRDDNVPIHRTYRHVAYRTFARWIWHILGKKKRKVEPACVVKKIREAFPSPKYCGFKYPLP